MNTVTMNAKTDRAWSRRVVNRMQLILLPALVCYLIAIILMKFTPALVAVTAVSCAAFIGFLVYNGVRNRSYRMMVLFMVKFVVLAGCTTAIWFI